MCLELKKSYANFIPININENQNHQITQDKGTILHSIPLWKTLPYFVMIVRVLPRSRF